jgi:dihydrofolate reductase
MKLSVIVAKSLNGTIGKNNKIPWHLPTDLKHFKSITTGYPVIMGRKTYQSIGKPLPKRTNIIVTRNEGFTAEGCLITHSLGQAVAIARKAPQQKAFIIGGAEIYKQALPFTDTIYLTEVKTNIEGDTYFPEINMEEWEEVEREKHIADDLNPLAFDFVTLIRKKEIIDIL